MDIYRAHYSYFIESSLFAQRQGFGERFRTGASPVPTDEIAITFGRMSANGTSFLCN